MDGSEVPFVFVKHRAPAPADWITRHPNFVKFPATLVVRREERSGVRGGGPQAMPMQGDATSHGDLVVTTLNGLRPSQVARLRKLGLWTGWLDARQSGQESFIYE